MRSGALGRKSLGSLPRKLVRRWLAARSEEQLFADSVGAAPSLADVLKLAHPKPATPEREALYAYLLGKECKQELLPEVVQQLERYKQSPRGALPNVPFHFLTSLQLRTQDWKEIARTASWQTTRMNLNTFARHGVFEARGLLRLVANRLRSPELIARARVFPFQLLAAYRMTSELPGEIQEALQDALELAIGNVPSFEGKVVVCPDVSGSMQSAISGHRQGATSKVRCIDVAALIACAVLRKNRAALVLPFETEVVSLRLNARDSVMTNAEKLASIGGGGTNCSAPLALLNANRQYADVVILVSDNESWVDAQSYGASATMQEWQRLKARCPKARLVCIDIQPNRSTQAQERADVLNVGGFSDKVFELVGQFARGELAPGHFVGRIEEVVL
jgi:60 kDa SS-A/Ro ribonucleoprotein